jgi:hypothetical protein
VVIRTVALAESSAQARLLTGIRLVCGDRYAGRAVTAELPAGDNLGVHLALERSEAGDVVCGRWGARTFDGSRRLLIFDNDPFPEPCPDCRDPTELKESQSA